MAAAEIFDGYMTATLTAAKPLADVYHTIATKLFIGHYDVFQIQPATAKLQAAAGLPEDQARFALCLLLAFPVSFFHRFVPTPLLKHLYSVIIGLWFLQINTGEGWVHLLISSTVVYSFLFVVRLKSAPLIAAIFTMAYMTCAHIYRQWEEWGSWNLDYTGAQMILTQKLVAYCCNIYDGFYNKAASEDQKSRALKRTPNPLEFYSFVFFPSSILAGPTYEIVEYLKFTDLTVFATDNSGAHRAGGRTMASLSKFLQAVACIAVNLGLAAYGCTSEYHWTKEWAALPWHLKMWWSWVINIQCRSKYYFAWKIGEGACVMAGLGFGGYDKEGNATWNGLTNIDIVGFETASSFHEASKKWNIQTSVWLSRVAMARSPKSIRLYATYLLSAFWHGFYPGYYLFFLTIAIVTKIANTSRIKLGPYFDTPSLRTPYLIFTTLVTTIWVNYFVKAFLLLNLGPTFQVWSDLLYFGHVSTAILFVVLNFVPKKKENKAE